MKKYYSQPEANIDLLLCRDVISTSYTENLNQPWEQDREHWGIIGN